MNAVTGLAYDVAARIAMSHSRTTGEALRTSSTGVEELARSTFLDKCNKFNSSGLICSTLEDPPPLVLKSIVLSAAGFREHSAHGICAEMSSCDGPQQAAWGRHFVLEILLLVIGCHQRFA